LPNKCDARGYTSEFTVARRLDVKDFNESQSGQRTLDAERLEALIEVLSRHQLGLQDTEPDTL